MMSRIAVLIAAGLIGAALVPGLDRGGSAQAGATRPSVPSASAKRGLAFATARCAGCHAVAPGQGSSNPEAPPFEAVANQRGLTGSTLRQFLRDSHSYPAAMEFEIDRAAINDLANYIITLKSENYRPAI
jgi:mono/diheme cytochrome c family protein